MIRAISILTLLLCTLEISAAQDQVANVNQEQDFLPSEPEVAYAPTRRLTVEALFLKRSQSFAGTLAVDEDNGQSPILTGQDLKFSTTAGPRITLGWDRDELSSFEATYFGLHDWTSSAGTFGNNNRSLPGDLGLATFDFFAADSIRANYGSRIHNVELSYISKYDRLEVLGGFRYLGVYEDFTLSSFDADTFQSNYNITADNNLFGGQTGIRYTFESQYFSIKPQGKIGVFGNSNSQHSIVRDLNNSLELRNVRLGENATCLLGEIRLDGEARLTQNISLNVGYNFIWVNHLALAPYQTDFSDTAASSRFVDNAHSLFLHGVNVGATITW